MSSRASLSLKDFTVMANVGVGETERSRKQEILVSVTIGFWEPPLACQTDEVKDTADYALLCKGLEEVLTAQPFNTIEAMAQAAVDHIVKLLAARYAGELEVEIKKPQPQIEGLTLGSAFCLRASL